MRRIVTVTLGVGFLFLAALQLIRPTIPSPDQRAEVSAPAAATQVLRDSCYSCHSNERRLSWFDEIAPAYWLVRHDVLDARRHVNFSTLGTKDPAVQRATLFEAANMAALGSMPLKSFTSLHPGARVNPTHLIRLKEFLAPWRDIPAISPDPTQLLTPADAAPTVTGLHFDPNFTDWHLLSVTDRGDNGTFRLILGNDIAVKAAQDGQVSPWPDGARFAKVAWKQRSAPNGMVLPGDFIQVEFMVKDARAFRSTDGWRWGRWKGAGLKPYGDNAKFVEECTGCHAPMRRNDFVYTMPISKNSNHSDQLNVKAAAIPKLPFDLIAATPITMYVDRARSTVSVLFSNGTQGKNLLLITWGEQDDPHWFGARIPAEFVVAEYVHTDLNEPSPAYTRIEKDGSVDNTINVSTKQSRMGFIGRLKLAPYLTH